MDKIDNKKIKLENIQMESKTLKIESSNEEKYNQIEESNKPHK